ncbi:MAG: dolichol-phosphate hexosyltransferase [Thermoproteota archaeon]|nr:dolichol-phosphate hexosyltransferase [Thermoproteota archaeon]
MENIKRETLRAAKIVYIIPTLNEAATKADVVKKAKKFAHRVVVVDGHSADGTCEVASMAGAEIFVQEGKGKGMALRTAFDRLVEGDVFVIIDGDGTYDVLETGRLLQPVLDGEADMVVGSRLRGEMEAGSISRTNMLGNLVFNVLINLRFNGKVSDSQSGYRVLNRRVVDKLNLRAKGFEVETEMTMKALKNKLMVKEIPIAYSKRRGSRTKLNSFKAGSRILVEILRSSV